MQTERVWDPITRLWHWLFAAAVVGNWLLGRFMTFDTVRWHFYGGYLVLALLAFRLIWGFCGPQPARFRSFLPTPAGVRSHLRTLLKREPGGAPGHNPLGALSVYAMLLVIALQAGAGLFIEADDFFEAAILHPHVSSDTASFMSAWHHTLPVIILILVVLHVVAIVFYQFWKRESLTRAMVTGRKQVRRD